MPVAGTSLPFSPAYQAVLSSTAPRRPTPADAFKAARRTWLAGERLDMAALALSLGISRPTLYKWCGDREQLLTDVIWSIADVTLDNVIAATGRMRGVNRALEVMARFTAATAASPPFKTYLRNETHNALRLLTTRRGFQDRLVNKIAEFLRSESERSSLTLRADPRLIAYAIVRTTEGFLYNDAVAAIEPRFEDARDIVRLILD
jgi:AcrR family transcriptional regulator